MDKIARFFITNYKFTLVLTVFVLLYGALGVRGINSESFPTVNIGVVIITTRYEGATAEDIETKITKPIEEEVQKVSGLKKVKSKSQAGFSTIVTEVDIDKYDVEKVISDLQRAVERTSGLPTDLLQKPVFTEIKSDEFPVIEVAVVGSNVHRHRDSVADLLREDLADNKKVSTVSLTGFRERQFNIYLDREALARYHVPILEVQRALAQRNINIPGGELRSGESQKLVRIEGKAQSVEALRELVVRSNFSGQQVRLGDIARIEDSDEEPITLSRYAGEPATLLTVTKKGGADLLKLVKEIEAELANYSAKYSDLKFVIFNSEGVRVSNRLEVLTSNGFQGLVLVVLILIVLIRGWTGVLTAMSMPISLFATIGVIYSLGFTLNTITIIGLVIALGMLVDNAIVISENFMRLRKEGFDVDESLLKTIRDLWAPITATVMTTIAAFAPMLVTTGVMGQFIKGIPIVVSIALLLSLFEGFVLLPTRLKILDKIQTRRKAVIGKNSDALKKDWLDEYVLPRFERHMTWAVYNKWKSFLIFTTILFASILLLSFGTKVNLFPSEQTEIYIGRLEMPKGTRVEAVDEATAEFTKLVQEKLGAKIKHIVQTSGQSATDPSDVKGIVGSNVSMIRIFVTRETTDTLKTNEVLELLRSIKNDKFSRVSFEALVNGPPVGDPVSVTFRSNNMKNLDTVAQRIRERISTVEGLFDAKVDDVFGDDEISVIVDYEKAARLGLSLQDIGLTVRTAIAGLKIGDVNLNNREVDYFLRFNDRDKQTTQQLAQVKIADQRGHLIPLGNIAQFSPQPGAQQIKRFDFRRSKTVTANLDDRVITSIEANALIAKEFEAIKNDFKDVSIVFAGEAEKTNESFESLKVALILSIIGIFALLVLVFNSYTSPFIILTTIPLGLVGVALAFTVQGKVLSFMSFIGIIGVGGIIVNAGIILISSIEKMKVENSLSLNEILIKTSVNRLRAVIATSVTNVMGLIPTAYGIGGVDYFIIPMALAIAWGLTTGTIFTLYWVPPAFAIVDVIKSKCRQFLGRATP